MVHGDDCMNCLTNRPPTGFDHVDFAMFVKNALLFGNFMSYVDNIRCIALKQNIDFLLMIYFEDNIGFTLAWIFKRKSFIVHQMIFGLQ